MKFKAVFVLFNVVIIVSFLVIYLMPLAMLGWDYTKTFWSENWGLPVLFVLILGILNAYFTFNWRLFGLLEREDWDGLIEHLEHRIYERHIIIAQQCRILVNAYLVRSRLDAIEKLEAEIEKRRPRLLRRLVMPLGIRYLLSNDPEAMIAFFGRFVDERVRDRGWVRVAYAFAKLLAGDNETAAKYLSLVVSEERNPVLKMLALYLAEGVSPGSHTEEVERLRERMSPEKLQDEIERQRSNVQVVILARLIDEAKEWLFSTGDSSAR